VAVPLALYAASVWTLVIRPVRRAPFR
jgi:hypothetical protein